MSHPIFFVYPKLADWLRELVVNGPEIASPDENPLAGWFRGSPRSIVVQSYVRLKRKGHDVRLTNALVPGAINVMFYDELNVWDPAMRQSFLVVVQADRPRAWLGDFRVVHNPSAVTDSGALLVPHWPQPALRARAAERKNRVENVAYLGRPMNLAPEFRDLEFQQWLGQHGFRLIVRENDWEDYSDVDVVLAVRPRSGATLDVKPPSKLTNSWLAGCPALLGAVPAFRALRQSELDYIQVSTPDDVLQALQRLRDEPELYAAMRARGAERAGDYTARMILARWEALFFGPVMGGYVHWKSMRSPLRIVWLPLKYAVRVFRHKMEGRRHRRQHHDPFTQKR